MSTLVLTCGSDPRAVVARRCGAGARLLVWARSSSLDRALGRGISPDASVALSLRAHALISTTHRLALAMHLRRIARGAGRARARFDPSVPVPSHVADVWDLLDEIIEVLNGAEAVDARGVAQLEMLLHDGGGPLFDARAAVALRRALENVVAALAPCSGASV